jgi:hypothetical protein
MREVLLSEVIPWANPQGVARIRGGNLGIGCVTNLSHVATYSNRMINRNRFYFFGTTKYKQKPKMIWSRKLYHPTVGESSEQRSSLLPRASFYTKGTIFTYSKSILIIALTSSSTMNLFSILALLKPSSSWNYLIPTNSFIQSSSWNCLIPTSFIYSLRVV